MQFNPYLNFNGQCKEAFTFYEQCLGGKIVAMSTHEEMPAGQDVPAEWKDLIMHARLQVGDAVLMGSDSPPEHFKEAQGIYVSLQVDDPLDAERIFQAFEEGGTVQMPIQETFWAARFGMVSDRFGTPWMINCEKAA
ncbi:MAG TPA: VOC family protein [Thermomicrobiales bacterium]|nr:VOC family protein [Thermomicrobiales bacterium]